MTIINVELEQGLSELEAAKILDFLSMIRGVSRIVGISEGNSPQQQTILPPEARGQMPPPQRQNPNINLDNINPAQKKHIIAHAIAWGSKKGKVNLDTLATLSPEELLALSTKFLGEMSDSEKDMVFKNLA